MASWVNVDRWVECSDVNGFLDTPSNPVLLRREYGNVFFPEVMLVVSGVLQHG